MLVVEVEVEIVLHQQLEFLMVVVQEVQDPQP
jgi:hypothetical protein